MRKFLWRPDPPSVKDWPARFLVSKAQAFQPSLPAMVRLTNQVVDVLDQGNLGACAANALAQAIRAGLIRQNAGVPVVQATLASRLFLYYMARAIDGDPQADGGTSFRSLLDAARRIGYPAERFWSYNDGPEQFKVKPSAEATRSAFDQKAGLSYHRLTSTGARRSFELRTLLAAGYVVLFGTIVSDRFENYGSNTPPLDPPVSGEIIYGGHGLLLAGYGPGYFEGPNSWGLNWGKRGWFQMTDAYIENWRSTDFWVLDAVAPFSEV